MLAGGKNSRLYKRLVYDMQIAQDVQRVPAVAGAVVVLPDRRRRRGPATRSTSCRRSIDEEIAEAAAASRRRAHELERSLNQIESSFYNRMERVGGFGGKADQLNAYYTDTGDPDWFNEDLGALPRAVAVRHPRRGRRSSCRATAASS